MRQAAQAESNFTACLLRERGTCLPAKGPDHDIDAFDTRSRFLYDIVNHTINIRKTPDSFRNPVFFMVAEAGLEPTTSGL